MTGVRTLLLGIVTCLVVGVLWHFAILFFHIPGYLVPEPLTVLGGFAAHAGLLAARAGFTVASALLGLVFSTVLATVIAGIYIVSPRAEQASMPIVIAFRSAPVAAVAPIIMLMLGRGMGTGVVVVIIVSLFPLLINLMRGMQAADRNALEMMHVYNASTWQNLRYVRLPSALPFFFSGLRIAGTNAVLGAMLSEWITGSRGLGLLILDSGEMRDIALLWAAVLISIFLALAIFWTTSGVERRLSRWRRSAGTGPSL